MTQHRDITVPKGDYILRRARVPTVFLRAPIAATVPDREGAVLLDIHIERGVVTSLRPSNGVVEASLQIVDVEGRHVWPSLVDMHTHLDKGEAIPRAMADGTLNGGATGTANDRAHWTHDDILARMDFGVRCAYAYGVSAIRTHIDSNHGGVGTSWAAFNELREAWKGRVLLQGVGLAPLDYFLTEEGVRLADLVAEAGGVLGGVTDGIGNDWTGASAVLRPALEGFLRLADERGLDADIHTDQTNDVAAFALPTIAETVAQQRFKGRVVCGHCVNLALQPDEIVQRTVALCRDAGVGIVTLPTPMMYLMDRAPGRTPRWRGVTAVNELRAGGVQVAVAGDNCRDAWFPYGDHDMLDTFRQAVRVLHLDHDMNGAPGTAGPIPAALIGAPAVGSISTGGDARLILFSARSLNEIMCRPQSDRIVLDRGTVISEPLPDYAELDMLLGQERGAA